MPLSQNPSLDRSLGRRHRAIVGLSEETDAVAIAVSEETHRISVAERGALRQLANAAELRSYLGGLLKGGAGVGTGTGSDDTHASAAML
ncbi:MAG: diadenylate cyclase [Candidatus Eisenbacteria bacterium]|nr:diadenylate cyclase [Candidatus Eisenbacteria bacterium]